MRAILLAGVAAIPLALFTLPASAQTQVPPSTSGPTAPGPTSPLPGGGPGGGDARGGELGANQAPGAAATPQTADTMPPPDQMNPRQVETAPPKGKAAGQANSEAMPAPKRADAPTGEQPKGDVQKSDMQKIGKAGNQAAASGGARGELTAEKRQTIKRDISRVNVRPVTNINFSVSVGTAVPRSVEMHVLPVTVVEVYPQYRGYSFFILADGRIVIVEPSTYEIVTIIAV